MAEPYDLSKVRIYDDRTRRYVTFSDMEKEFKKLAIQQSDELMNDAEGNPIPKPGFEAAYKERIDNIKEYIAESLAANIATHMIERIAESMTESFEQADVSANVIVDRNSSFGGWFGNYIELEWFGLQKNSSPFADIEPIQTEIKAHTGDREELQVAGITINDLPPGFDVDENFARVMAIYKMTLKMQNFLMVKTKTLPTPKGKRTILYEEISLHMQLIFKKLWEKVYNESIRVFEGSGRDKAKGVIYIATKSGWKNGNASFDVKLNLKKIADVYEFLELYLYHENLLPDLKSSAEARAKFFGGIRRMKDEWELKGFGESPKFKFKIRY